MSVMEPKKKRPPVEEMARIIRERIAGNLDGAMVRHGEGARSPRNVPDQILEVMRQEQERQAHFERNFPPPPGIRQPFPADVIIAGPAALWNRRVESEAPDPRNILRNNNAEAHRPPGAYLVPPLPPPHQGLNAVRVPLPNIGLKQGDMKQETRPTAEVPSKLYRPIEPSPDGEHAKPRIVNVKISRDIMSYAYIGKPEEKGALGLFVGPKPLSDEVPFFEVQILSKAEKSGLMAGLCPETYPFRKVLGTTADSIGFHLTGECVYRGGSKPNLLYGPPVCQVGDKISCGIRPVREDDRKSQSYQILFTVNGVEIDTAGLTCPLPPGGFYPAIGFRHPRDEVAAFKYGAKCSPDEERMIVVGAEEDEWRQLHEVRFESWSWRFPTAVFLF